MSGDPLKAKIARLKHQVERLSAEQAKAMSARPPNASPRTRAMDAKRAELLAKRLRELDEMLERLGPRRADDAEPGSETRE